MSTSPGVDLATRCRRMCGTLVCERDLPVYRGFQARDDEREQFAVGFGLHFELVVAGRASRSRKAIAGGRADPQAIRFSGNGCRFAVQAICRWIPGLFVDGERA